MTATLTQSALDPVALEEKLLRNEPLTGVESLALSRFLMTMGSCLRAGLGKNDPDSATGYRLLERSYDEHFACPATKKV